MPAMDADDVVDAWVADTVQKMCTVFMESVVMGDNATAVNNLRKGLRKINEAQALLRKEISDAQVL